MALGVFAWDFALGIWDWIKRYSECFTKSAVLGIVE
ncbi:MAG: hypothetical protein ACJAUR_001606 [Ulvibacter sp.]|jgi:hypothetical protein